MQRISSTLRKGKSVFFNRSKEINYLSNRFSENPVFTVMLGPPSSGKTALVRQVLQQEAANGSPMFHPLFINLRSVDVSSSDCLFHSLADQVSLPTSGWLKNISKLEYENTSIDSSKITAQLQNSPKFSNFTELLAELKKKMNPFDIWHGERPIVLVVDEANRFKDLSNTHDLETFLAFAVEVTKETKKCHVIFTSSDSFFESWLTKYVPPTHFQTLVLGDLPVMEAFQFYLSEVENRKSVYPKFPLQLFDLDYDNFKKNVFPITGGRMWIIEEYIVQILVSRSKISNAMDFLMVENAVSHLSIKCFNHDGKSFKHVLDELVNSPYGYVDYSSLCSDIGKDAVSALISDNIIHCRPRSGFSRDLFPMPDAAVVTAPSQPALRAMEIQLKKL